MTNQARLLVPLDGSAFAEAALPVALGAARGLGARVELVSVIYELDLIRVDDGAVGSSALGESADTLRREVQEYHDLLIDRILKVSSVSVSSTVLHGSAAQKLEDRIRETTPDLVVMSTHGRGMLSRAWLGSVADRLVRNVDAPLLLVRPTETDQVTLNDTHAFKHVVVALDGSSRAEQTIPLALRVAKPLGARFTLVRVVPMPARIRSAYVLDTNAVARQVMERGQEEAAAYLDRVLDRVRSQGVAAEAAVVTGDPPAQGILRHAEQAGADLIALATQGRGGIARALLGSVADKVLRAADVPVLIQRVERGET